MIPKFLLSPDDTKSYLGYLHEVLASEIETISAEGFISLGFASTILSDLKEIDNIVCSKLKQLDHTKISKEREFKYSNDNKVKKYFDWVEIFRLIKFQFSRYSNLKRSYTEAAYSTVPLMIINHLEHGTGGKLKILDAGCGPGRILLELSKLFPQSDLLGVDYSLPMLYFADKILKGTDEVRIPIRKMGRFEETVDKDYTYLTLPGFGRKNINLGVVNLSEEPPFQDGEFDLITAVNSLNLLKDPSKSFGDLLRVLKRGGLVVIADLLGWKLDRELERRVFADGARFYSYFEKLKDVEILDYFYGGPYCEEYNEERMDVFTQHIICLRRK